MTTGRDITIRQDPAHAEGLPPILLGNDTQNVRDKVAGFYNAVAQIFKRWVTRMPSANTRRAYRHDVLSFCEFAGIAWPDDATRLFTVTVAEVLAFRDMLVEDDRAPKTINRRIASISSFYKYLQAAASELRLPSRYPTRPTPSSSPAAPPTRSTNGRPSPPPEPVSSWDSPRATPSSNAATGRF